MRTEVRGVTIDHEVTGAGRPLVWGHGLTSSRADEVEPPSLLDWTRLAGAARVVRYDARGHGRSGYTDDPGHYGWDALAADQLALAEALGVDRFTAGGASMGAATALHAAAMAPERIERLVLAIPPTAWETRAEQAGIYLQMADIVQARGVEPLIRAGADLPPPDPLAGEPTWEQRRVARLRSADPVRLAGVLRGAATTDLPPPEVVAAIDAPTLVLAWTGDAAHPVSTAERLVELMAGAELAVAATAAELATWTDRISAFLGR